MTHNYDSEPDEVLEQKLRIMKQARDDDTVADAAFEHTQVITEEERDEYNRINEKIYQAEVDRLESYLNNDDDFDEDEAVDIEIEE